MHDDVYAICNDNEYAWTRPISPFSHDESCMMPYRDVPKEFERPVLV